LPSINPYTRPDEAVQAAAIKVLHDSGKIRASLKPVPSSGIADEKRQELRKRINTVCDKPRTAVNGKTIDQLVHIHRLKTHIELKKLDLTDVSRQDVRMEFEGAFVYENTLSGLTVCTADDEIKLIKSLGKGAIKIRHAGVADYISAAARTERTRQYHAPPGFDDVNIKVTEAATQARNNYAVEL